jgi:hypothetical protein
MNCQYYWSATNRGFYSSEEHGTSIPEDAQPITVEEWESLLKGQSEGNEIASDAEGKPILQKIPDAPPLTAEQKLANAGLTVDDLKQLLGI